MITRKIIMVTWNGKAYQANVTDDYEVMLLGLEDEELIDVQLDQCKCCGKWCSEEEGYYGDGYCDGCAALCIHCSGYFNAADMIAPKNDEEEHVCKECHLKEAKKLWAELRDIPVNKDEEIDVDWHNFTKGTEREEIWHWFEEEYDLSVAKDLMGL